MQDKKLKLLSEVLRSTLERLASDMEVHDLIHKLNELDVDGRASSWSEERRQRMAQHQKKRWEKYREKYYFIKVYTHDSSYVTMSFKEVATRLDISMSKLANKLKYRPQGFVEEIKSMRGFDGEKYCHAYVVMDYRLEDVLRSYKKLFMLPPSDPNMRRF